MFLKNLGYLTDQKIPARAGLILSAFKSFDPEGYSFSVAEASTKGGRQRWLVIRSMCHLHKINLAPDASFNDPIRAAHFYNTSTWRRLRMKVLEARGARCECCGASAADGKRIHVDHIKPRSRYPELELEESNLQILCLDCNLGKMASYTTDWRPEAANG